MRIHYTKHAHNRMEERRVSKELVEMCLNSPDERYPDASDKLVYAKRVGDRLIRVIVKQKSINDYLIITVKD